LHPDEKEECKKACYSGKKREGQFNEKLQTSINNQYDDSFYNPTRRQQ
jgi:hypothetical protein